MWIENDLVKCRDFKARSHVRAFSEKNYFG